MIPNFNHSRYLDECIRSALDQTWPHCEIVVLDNQSEDDSVAIAAKYQERGVRVCLNMQNMMSKSYRLLADRLTSGEYMLLLGADDAIHPEFAERAVRVMQRHPNVGFVHGERDFVLEDGTVIELDPFFTCSFVAPGENVMPIFMVTTIAHPAQGFFRRSAFERIGGYEMEIDHMNADKSLWFYLSSVCDYAYIREKMCRIRVSSDTQTSLTVRNFQHPVLCHLTINDFVRFARQYGYPKVLARKEEALQRLAQDCLIWAGGALAAGERENARSFLDYARLLDRGVSATERWQRLNSMRESEKPDLEYITGRDVMFTARKRNYAPPEGFVPMDALTGETL
jgi:glycosyltransferase involved in cell wall biosynthesis